MKQRTAPRRESVPSEAVSVLLVALLALSPLRSAAAVPGATRTMGASALVPVAGWPSLAPAPIVDGLAGPETVSQIAALVSAGASVSGVPAGALSEADAATRDRVKAGLGKLPLYFIENQGQIDARAAYYVQGSATSVYFTKTGIVYALSSRTREKKEPAGIEGRLRPASFSPGNRDLAPEAIERHAIRLDFEGANPDVKVRGEQRTEAVVSYFKGRPSEWKTGLPTYGVVVYEELWPGIDLVYGGESGKLKYSFVVKPGADPRRIRLTYRGASAVRLTEAGRLKVETTAGGFEEDVPYAYQERQGEPRTEVSAAFAPETRSEGEDAYRFGFRVGAYDTTRTLVLDPVVLVYCGYIGGSSDEFGTSIAVDGLGNAYVAGYTVSTELQGFPVVVGSWDTTHGGAPGGYDAFVAKVNAAGTALVYCGYIGGSGDDIAFGIALDGLGSAYVTGQTASTEATFPVTVGPALTANGGWDAFVAKINPAGTALVYCGYIGGADNDYGFGIAVDASGNGYVAGFANSSEAQGFPVTVGPDLTYNGGGDAFVAKLDTAGTAFAYCGYIGGSGDDIAFGIALDGFGNAYVRGDTSSTQATFPVTVGPILTHSGSYDVFVAKVDTAGTALVYCGYIGGSGEESGNAIAVDGSGNAYLTGYTNSTEAQGFPVTVGPDLTYNGGTNDAFVAKVVAAGTALAYCGYIGGSGDDGGIGVAADAFGNAYVTGNTASSEAQGFPVAIGPDLTFNGGTNDAFVAKVSAAGTTLAYCGYVGGSGDDVGNAIAVDASGSAYVTGYTGSSEAQGFPVAGGPDLSHNGATYDTFVAKIAAPNGPQMRVLSGSYTGNGADNRPIFVGFQPDVVIVDRDDQTPPGTNYEAVIRTSTMTGDNSKNMDHATGVALAANLVQSLDPQGFTIGTDINVNESGTTYYWIAFRAAPGQLAVGTYSGTGVAQDITTVGFAPAYVLAMSEGARNVVQKSAPMPANFSLDFTSVGYTDAILNLRADGFRVGTNPIANENLATFRYVAWAGVPGRVAVGSYAGDNAASHDITGVGFWPEWVVVNRSANVVGSQANAPVHKPASSGVSTDLSPLFDTAFAEADNIRNLQADGFQVGFRCRVNGNGVCVAPQPVAYYWAAFGPHLPQANYRSIGTRADYGTTQTDGNGSSVTATNGSPLVTCAGTCLWRSFNRGRGDVIEIDPGAVPYTIAAVNAENQLTLTTPYAGVTSGGKAYRIRRQYATLQAWEDCISQGVGCTYFPVAGGNLVADDRSEVGIAYKDSVFTAPLTVDDSTTDATHTITLTADGVNRNYGLPGTGVVIDTGAVNTVVVEIGDDFVTVEGMEIKNAAPAFGDGIKVDNLATSSASQVVLRNNLIHNVRGCGVGIYDDDGRIDFYNNIVHSATLCGVWIGPVSLQAGSRIRILNNTIYGNTFEGIGNFLSGVSAAKGLLLRNNISVLNGSPDFDCDAADSLDPASSNNLSEDGTSGACSPAGGSVTSGVPAVQFVNAAGGNFHLGALSTAINVGADLSGVFTTDIDAGIRTGVWDIGADEFGATTAVKLSSFTAVPGDRSVVLEWRTGSELDNLGFHLYRGPSEGGPWARLTSSLIPGLGSSAVGQAYSYRDAGLQNGTRYYYRLEDVDASAKATSHGPISATPAAGAAGGAPGSEPPSSSPSAKKKGASAASCPDWVVAAYGSMAGASAASVTLSCTRHGDPEAVSLGVVSRDSRQATLELRTGGFYALHEASGKVRVYVPGFDFPQDPQAAALPVRRALVDAVVGRRAQLGGVRASEQVGFTGLVPASLGKAEMQVSRDGTVRAARRVLQESSSPQFSTDLARLLPSVFQGETKSAVVQITPLRFDARRGQIVLSKRVLVKLLFTARETGESGRGRFGRRERPEKPVSGELLARLYTTGRGLYAASFEQLFPGRQAGLASSQLRLERQGQAQGLHIAPASDVFGPGSVLYFYADTTASSTDFSAETAWELLRARDGLQMPLVSVPPSGGAVTSASMGRASFETNRFYQPGLLEAPDLWLWEALGSGATRAKSFTLTGVAAASSQAAEIEVFVQGASESGNSIDHHVSVSLNGVPVGDAQFAGKKPYRMSLSVPQAVLHEGANELQLTNVGDTGVSSFVFLDRFTVSYPQTSSLASGAFEGTWAEAGTATVSAVNGAVALVDVTASAVTGASSTAVIGASSTTPLSSSGALWLTGYESAGSLFRFRAEAGHRYLAVSQQALLTARVAVAAPSSLRATQNQADYLLIAPRAFLAVAGPLLQRRHDQGLETRAVAFEEIADEFGHGQPSAEAIKSFLGYAFQSWTRPSPRYVLLLGDSTYDPRNFTGTSQPSPLPALWTKTSYLWTASDPGLAAVNGGDALPDLAIGRLPATTVEQAQILVGKLIAWEESGQGLSGAAALVADNPDLAGDFEANARDIAESFLPGRSQLLLLSQLGPATRPAIQEAMNSGLSLLSYVGHGGAAVWASENVWNSWDAPSLQAQSQQPLLVTMNCFNGYFVAPAFDSLSESLLKAEGRGAIAAFSPSGLSLDGPAHQYHRALMAELTSGRHARLGDAVLAAQKAYAQTGLMPELVSVYHLLGDPGMKLQ